MQIRRENRNRVDITVLMAFDNDMIAFEERIGFVGRKMELVLIVGDENRRSFSHFFPVAKFDIVREREFAKTHKSKESSKQHALKQKIVMI